MANYVLAFQFHPNFFFDGFNQTPDGYFGPPPPRFYNHGLPPRFIGDDLPPVDPFNYSGVVHFGPSFTILGPHPPEIPPGAGVFDPYLVVPGSATLRFDY